MSVNKLVIDSWQFNLKIEKVLKAVRNMLIADHIFFERETNMYRLALACTGRNAQNSSA